MLDRDVVEEFLDCELEDWSWKSLKTSTKRLLSKLFASTPRMILRMAQR